MTRKCCQNHLIVQSFNCVLCKTPKSRSWTICVIKKKDLVSYGVLKLGVFVTKRDPFRPVSADKFWKIRPDVWIDVYMQIRVGVYLTIIPRMRVRYELLDSGRGAEHRVGFHKLIWNKREWSISYIKYQTLNKNISNLFSTYSSFRPFWGKFSVIKLPVSIFGQTIGYRIYTVSKEPNESDYQKFINKYK